MLRKKQTIHIFDIYVIRSWTINIKSWNLKNEVVAAQSKLVSIQQSSYVLKEVLKFTGLENIFFEI